MTVALRLQYQIEPVIRAPLPRHCHRFVKLFAVTCIRNVSEMDVHSIPGLPALTNICYCGERMFVSGFSDTHHSVSLLGQNFVSFGHINGDFWLLALYSKSSFIILGLHSWKLQSTA
jgi:hypothetical protein